MAYNSYDFFTKINGAFVNLIAGYAVDFGIDAAYATNASAFNKHCFVGINRLYINFNTSQAIFWADLTSNPIAKYYYLNAGSGISV